MKYLFDSFSEDEQNDLTELEEEFELAAEMRLSLLEKYMTPSPDDEEKQDDEPTTQE